MQKMIVGYESALEFWRRARAASLTPAEDDLTGRIYGARPLDPAELSARAAGMMGVEEPIDVVVAERGERRWNSRARYHLWKGPLDDRHLLGLGGGVFVCTMPVVLVQLARTYERTELADRLRQSSVIPDFSWYNRVIMEYDSDEEHLSPEAKARDERKRRAYRDVGLDCLTMTSDIPASNRKLNGFIEDLEKSLRIRRRPLTPKMLDARAELREALFGPEAVGEALEALNRGDG